MFLIYILTIRNFKGQWKKQFFSNKHYPKSLVPNAIIYLFPPLYSGSFASKVLCFQFSFDDFLPAKYNPLVHFLWFTFLHK